MPRTRVKICGITSATDAQLAAGLGADAVGLIFHQPSSRAVSPGTIREIVGKLPAFVTVVGLFVDPSEKQVSTVLDSGLVQCLQFHGNESVQFCAAFRVPFIKAIRVKDLKTARLELEPFQGACSVILDSYVKGAVGGTGKTFDWAIARQLVNDKQNPIILAGGLAPENIASAIVEVSPYGVDVCSGVEHSPGVKDARKLEQFFEAVHA